MVYFTIGEFITDLNDLIKTHFDKEINQGTFLMENNSKGILLLAKDMEGLVLGIDVMEEIFQQTFDNYFAQNKLDDFIKIRPFKMK